MIAKLQKGATVPVKVDPYDRTRVALAMPT
jgi:hypothetical protein